MVETSRTIPGKATLEIEEGNILRIRMLPNSNIDIDAAKAIVQAAKELSGTTKHANLLDIREMVFISREARAYFASQERKNVVAIAILMNSIFHNVLANLYFKFNKPRILTKEFDKEVDALDWMMEKLR
jgi:hypothetical protein